MHITIGMPLYNNMPIETFISFLKLIENIEKKINYNFINTRNYPVHHSRDFIVEQFLKKESDYLLFLDSDMVFPSDMVSELLLIDADISSGVSFKKVYPYEPTIYKKSEDRYQSINNYEEGKVIEVDATGMACCLIKRKVFERIQPPWFEFEKLKDRYLGEDLTFCRKAKEVGFNIKVNTKIIVPHIGGVIDDKVFQGIRHNLTEFQSKNIVKTLLENIGEKEILEILKSKREKI